ncbi:MAG: energy-coupling factor ABC transporter ATP-binding protein [Nitrososphaerales archaeon]
MESESKDNAYPRPIISIRDLQFRYYATGSSVLDRVNLEINSGEIVLIAGRSGSGKSTLLRAINGLIPHQHAGEYSGSVTVNGLVVANSKMSDISRQVGYVFQNPENQIFMFSVERDIAFGPENLALERDEIRRRVDWALSILDIKHLALRAPHELSDGQKQRVAIAGSLAMGQKILILDEPTSLLDPFTAKELIEVVKVLHDTYGITVLIVEHRLDLVARIASRVVVMDQGRVVADGEPKKVMYSENLSDYGVRDPTIVSAVKLIGNNKLKEAMPFSPQDLADSLNRFGSVAK